MRPLPIRPSGSLPAAQPSIAPLVNLANHANHAPLKNVARVGVGIAALALIAGAAYAIQTGVIGWSSPFAQLFESDAAHGASDVTSRQAATRAVSAWNALNRTDRSGGLASSAGTGLYRATTVSDRSSIAAAWSQSQVQAGALNLSVLTGDRSIVETLDQQTDKYEWAKGYQADFNPIPIFDPRGHEHYSDDNTAIGLNYVQQYDQTGDTAALDKAEKVVDFVMSMEDGTGLNWRTGSTSYVATSITAGQKLALMVAERRPQRKEEFVAFAKRLEQFQETRLRVRDGDREGLVRDNVMSDNETAGWSEAVFSYNEGWTIGADIEWFKLTGEQRYLDRARHTADRTLEYFEKVDKDGLWKQPASFNANFFENLLALDQIDPAKSGETRPYDYEQVFSDYLDRAWNDARDPKTGYFNRNGFGMYGITEADRAAGAMTSIDQAAMVQMYALRAMTAQQRNEVA